MRTPVTMLRAAGRAAFPALGLPLMLSCAVPAKAPAAAGGIPVEAPAPEGVPAHRHALLIDGRARPPLAAPRPVDEAIRAANRIATKPYVWGGGHGRWRDRGYDCSGAVSFALHGAGLLGRPLDSGRLMSWGAPGPGRWITVYANARHAFATIAGLRWDTSEGPGPRWHRRPGRAAGFRVRHPVGY